MANNDLKTAVYGFIVGDALGVPYEFLERHSFCCTTMQKGIWSDDSSMVLATCDSIRKLNLISPVDIRNNFLKWYVNDEYTPENYAFGIGKTTKTALLTGVSQKEITDNGNGALMRILPLAFLEASKDEIIEVASITHGNEISNAAVLIYINVLRNIKKESLSSILAEGSFSYPFTRLKNLDILTESDIKSTGYVVDTLEACLWCVLKTSSYKEAVLKAVNLGGDTDTIAALTGGIASLIYGFDSIPKEWIELIKNKKLIEKCLF